MINADIIHHAPFGVIVLDAAGGVVLANPQAEAFGLVRDGGLVPRYADDLQALAQCALEDTHPAHGSVRVRRGGQKLAIAARAQRLAADDEQVVLYLSDASDAKRMESARRDFVANVSHELKTPVGALALLSEALLEAPEDTDSVTYFGQKIHTEALRMGNMITELISLSKLQGAASLPQLAEVHVPGVIAEAIARNQIAADTAGIRLVGQGLVAGGPVLQGDRQLLITAVANLISNAVNYSPGGSSVTVRATEHASDPDLAGVPSVRIDVVDHGIGIAPKHHARVFERFFRVDKARSRSTGGTGLGLAIVKHVAANHAGRVAVSSAVGEGSTFTLILPREPQNE
ncbi:two-component sensor histidine kinase [Corynebacterium sp. 13CS0277]|uniref:sensor histidine kinase n=1 Tax=Corynebacterium sp. 13CS0277 TaxID=2071994 RepID=UPI000D02D3F5|nr:ATP-binding protein [Corynebacterium sp. 13CS0277]PRQ10688.1 two-component sensor histidine kinase [Corynebacterium sp. 13CS0277]